MSLALILVLASCLKASGQEDFIRKEVLEHDFQQFRQLLEENHCCLYEYSSKPKLDSLFEAHYDQIRDSMHLEDFFRILAPLTAEIGCMHTATWMPGYFFSSRAESMFPLKVRLIEGYLVVTGSYNESVEVPRGSIILAINNEPVNSILEQLRAITSADARNPWFVDAQLTKRFSMFYASCYGIPEQYEVLYALPGRKTSETKRVTPATIEAVRNSVFAHFSSPPLKLEWRSKALR
jgi:hypothetical protein